MTQTDHRPYRLVIKWMEGSIRMPRCRSVKRPRWEESYRCRESRGLKMARWGQSVFYILTQTSYRDWADKTSDFHAGGPWFEPQAGSCCPRQGALSSFPSHSEETFKPLVPCIGESRPMHIKETTSFLTKEQREIPVRRSDKYCIMWLFARWFYLCEFCESVLAKISISIHGYS